MTITKEKDAVIQTKDWHGILECAFKYKIKEPEVLFKYTGPKIDPLSWHQLMSFFRWTQQEAHSEAQARGFVDPVTNTLFFWAFPQEARTGMTSKEIPGDDFNSQRAALPNAGSLELFMTVHHHCSASAFQSGGDAANEERPGGGAHETGQEGLHITMGFMDKDVHDIHMRFYFGGVKMTPSMHTFWDIGDATRSMIPADLHDKVARWQMCQKVELPFPDQWKANYREIKEVERPKTTTSYQGGLGYGGSFSGQGVLYRSLKERIEASAEEIASDMLEGVQGMGGISLNNFELSLKFFQESELMQAILDEAMRERYDAIDIRNLIANLKDELDDYVASMDPSVEAVDNPANNGKGKKRKKRRDNVDKAAESVEVVNPSPAHGDLNGMGQTWDSDLNQWTGPTAYD